MYYGMMFLYFALEGYVFMLGVRVSDSKVLRNRGRHTAQRTRSNGRR